MPGQMGIGHVRYSTTGCSMRENTQPLVLKYIKGTLSIAHNGNLTNTAELRDELERTGAIFQTTTDSEVMSYLIARGNGSTVVLWKKLSAVSCRAFKVLIPYWS